MSPSASAREGLPSRGSKSQPSEGGSVFALKTNVACAPETTRKLGSSLRFVGREGGRRQQHFPDSFGMHRAVGERDEGAGTREAGAGRERPSGRPPCRNATFLQASKAPSGRFGHGTPGVVPPGATRRPRCDPPSGRGSGRRGPSSRRATPRRSAAVRTRRRRGRTREEVRQERHGARMVTSSSCVLAQAYRTRCKRARLQSNSTEKESVRTFVAASIFGGANFLRRGYTMLTGYCFFASMKA